MKLTNTMNGKGIERDGRTGVALFPRRAGLAGRPLGRRKDATTTTNNRGDARRPKKKKNSLAGTATNGQLRRAWRRRRRGAVWRFWGPV
mmetsp:Transcript_3756/g.12244  ORF Transcript_3756/g.12244 Transcript_3756/m.12244 type:complete len:89 (+) Transcript_3756:421-687(+)